MKWLILFCLVFTSYCTFGQLPNDSLGKIVSKQYKEEFAIGKSKYWQEQLDKGNIYEKAEQLFNGYFDSVGIFLVDYDRNKIDLSAFYHGGPGGWPKVYALNVYTGLQVSLENESTFLRMLNASKSEINNLDKCYLYLLLNRLETIGITQPNYYRSKVRLGEVFSSYLYVFVQNAENCSWDYEARHNLDLIIRDDIKNSDRWNIKIHVVKIIDKMEATYRYTFIFGSKRHLVHVDKEFLSSVKYKRCTNG